MKLWLSLGEGKKKNLAWFERSSSATLLGEFCRGAEQGGSPKQGDWGGTGLHSFFFSVPISVEERSSCGFVFVLGACKRVEGQLRPARYGARDYETGRCWSCGAIVYGGAD